MIYRHNKFHVGRRRLQAESAIGYCCKLHVARSAYSKAKIRFQSRFMLITVQPFALLHCRVLGKCPDLDAGSPRAGPYSYSRLASS